METLSAMTNFLPPKLAKALSETQSPIYQLQRAEAVSREASRKPDCSIEVHIGIFFDGTNNNMERDKDGVRDPNKRSHSNVVVLHDAFADDVSKHRYKIYLPGVGTIFEKVGEPAESREGKSMAKGGAARIYWAMIQVFNALHHAVFLGEPMITDERATWYVTSKMALGAQNLLWKAPSPDSLRRKAVFERLGRELADKLTKQKSPSIRIANLSVFGFSRGAAEARTFCNWMNDLRDYDLSHFLAYGNTFFGVPLRFQFLGLFDTVASVGLANSAPVSDGGFMGWADGTMELPACIERCVHLTAAHEIRKSFPLSTARKSACHVEEYIYPGAHSDVGGGYAPGEQGKGKRRSELLSQVPLVHMYREARKAGVPLMNASELDDSQRDQTRKELELDSQLIAAFNDYRRLGPGGGEIRKTMFEHLRLYWRWRLSVGKDFKSLSSYQAASEQDKEDLAASEADFLREIMLAERDEETRKRAEQYGRQANYRSFAQPTSRNSPRKAGDLPPDSRHPTEDNLVLNLTEAEQTVLAEKRGQTSVPAAVAAFFDKYVHDSHASFYMLGPVTAYERKLLIESIEKKQRDGKSLNSFERRVIALQRTKPGSLPVITDSDYADLLEGEDVQARTIIPMMTATRRESEGHVRERVIFDKS